jgi:hypothetical protein
MNLYDVVVRVGGSLYNEVERLSITAPEVVMLQALHGDDSVLRIKHVGTSDETDSMIRDRMCDFFGTGRVETARSGPELMKQYFGPKSMPLPDHIDGVTHINPQMAKEVAPIVSLTAE